MPRSSSEASLLDRLDVGEGILARAARHVRLAQQPPLLQIPQMVLGDPRVETAHLPMAERPTGG